MQTLEIDGPRPWDPQWVPPELLSMIFGLLTAEERLLVKLVCRHWRYVVNGRVIWRDEKVRPEWFLRELDQFVLFETKLVTVPLSRLLRALTLSDDMEAQEEIFMRLVRSREESLNPDVLKLCGEQSKSEAVQEWCAGWEPEVADVRLYEAASSGSPKSARLAIRSGATLVDWALSGAVRSGHVRSTNQLLKKGARDWAEGCYRQSECRDVRRARDACRKWNSVCV